MSNQSKAYLFALLSVFLWSTVASAFKISLEYLNTFELLFYSSFFSSIILFLMLLTNKKLILLKGIGLKQWAALSGLGFLNPFLYYLFLFKAYDILPAQEALTLNYTWAIFVVILSIPLLKQKITLISFGSIIISFSGVIVIATRGEIFLLSFSNLYGVTIAIISAFIWALFWILNLKNKNDVYVKLFIIFLSGFIFSLAINLIFGNLSQPNFQGLLGSLYVGCFEMGITFLFWLFSLKLSSSTAKVANLIYLSPFISLLIINIILDEKILTSSIVGLLLIIGGICVQLFSRGDRNFVNQ